MIAAKFIFPHFQEVNARMIRKRVLLKNISWNHWMFTKENEEKLNTFLSDNVNSFNLPWGSNHIYGKNEKVESKFSVKKLMPWTFN